MCQGVAVSRTGPRTAAAVGPEKSANVAAVTPYRIRAMRVCSRKSLENECGALGEDAHLRAWLGELRHATAGACGLLLGLHRVPLFSPDFC